MTSHLMKRVAIVGAGAAGLMAADRLSEIRPDLLITLYDAMPSPARKILMAGKSGLNISHKDGVEAPDRFLSRYSNPDFIQPFLAQFSTQDIVDWMAGLGQTCFIGSSGRIFPDCMKASPLLRALLSRLDARGVTLQSRHRWIGWTDDGTLLFESPDGQQAIAADATLLALGGPSWPRLGTDGAFVQPLQEKGLHLHPFRPANCGFDVQWPEGFADQWAGHPVKSVVLSFGDQSVQGDFVMTRHGLEGGSVYALSAPLRDAIEADGHADLCVDLRPNQSKEALVAKLSRPRGKQSLSNHLRKTINLKGSQAALLKAFTDREMMQDPERLAHTLKALILPLIKSRPMTEAISTAGGIALDEVDENLMAHKVFGLFIAGEMLDWEAPTGGYLLTACLSQGRHAAHAIADYLPN